MFGVKSLFFLLMDLQRREGECGWLSAGRSTKLKGRRERSAGTCSVHDGTERSGAADPRAELVRRRRCASSAAPSFAALVCLVASAVATHGTVPPARTGASSRREVGRLVHGSHTAGKSVFGVRPILASSYINNLAAAEGHISVQSRSRSLLRLYGGGEGPAIPKVNPSPIPSVPQRS